MTDWRGTTGVPMLMVALLLAGAGCSDDPEPVSSRASSAPTSLAPDASATTGASGGPATSSPPAPTPGSSAPGSSSAAPGTPGPTPRVPGLASSAAIPPPPPTSPIRLIGDGIDLPARVVTFGDTYASARPRLDAALGRPTTDTGVIDSFSVYGTCPGSDLRVLEYAGGALQLLFGTLEGSRQQTFYNWGLTNDGRPALAPRARALIGDQATFSFGVGTTVAQLREGLGSAVDVQTGDEIFGPSFAVDDQSGGFFGYLDTTAASGRVEFVEAGQACGE